MVIQKQPNTKEFKQGDKKHIGNLPNGYTKLVCANFQNWQYEDLPDNVVKTVKYFILDTIGVIAGAANAPGIYKLNKRLTSWEKNGPSTALIGKWKASPPTVALANGAAAHALDFDDMHDPARVHAYCVNLPAVLAAAETQPNIDGKNFVAAIATGVEFHGRLGLTCPNSLGRGWHPTMVLGLPSAALAVGRILKLKDEKLVNSLAIAYHQTSGSRQPMFDGDLCKRIGAGFAARSAVLAGFLALDGISGPVHAFEGEAGYFHMYERDDVIPEILSENIGDKWEILNYSMKPFPCCRCTHNFITIGLELNKEGLDINTIEKISLYMGKTNWQIVGQQPYQVQRNSVVHAQFNAAYCFGRALASGTINLRSFQPPHISDDIIAELSLKTFMYEDVTYPPTAMEPARVEILLKNGSTIVRSLDKMKGSPSLPMSDEEAIEKFLGCLEFGMNIDEISARTFADMVINLEQLDRIQRLVSAFPTPKIM